MACKQSEEGNALLQIKVARIHGRNLELLEKKEMRNAVSITVVLDWRKKREIKTLKVDGTVVEK